MALQHRFQVDQADVVREKRLRDLFKAPSVALLRNHGIEGLRIVLPLLPRSQHAVAAKGDDHLVRQRPLEGGEHEQHQNKP